MAPLAHFWSQKYDFRRSPKHWFFDIFIKGRSVKYSKSIARNVVLGHQKALIWASIIEEFFGSGQKPISFTFWEARSADLSSKMRFWGSVRNVTARWNRPGTILSESWFFHEFRRVRKTRKNEKVGRRGHPWAEKPGKAHEARGCRILLLYKG